jgi:Domain of unknown function (DUF4136)
MTTWNARPITRLATLVGLGLLLASCATRYDIRSQAAANASLASYHTYAFIAKPGTDKDGYKSLVTQTLERAVNREMYARGYTPAAVGSEPDLVINFNVKEKDKVEGDGPGVGYGFGLGYGRHWGYGYGFGLDDYNNTRSICNGNLRALPGQGSLVRLDQVEVDALESLGAAIPGEQPFGSLAGRLPHLVQSLPIA